ncbi:ankyrin repeat domain-containing protein [Malaciobacter halophilus]|nr:ankyrin repeat domain-containing protein [Malaciobacter halophilus]RYA23946.1 ankyrin repeat domain-containing protein [Malaciobacter halophilus]
MSTNIFIDDKLTNKNLSLKKLIFSGLDINHQDSQGWCILFETIVYNENIEAVLSLNPDIDLRDKKGRNALYWAIKYKNFKAVKLLISKGIDMYVTPTLYAVHFAVYNDDVKMLKCLKNCDVDINYLDEINATALIYAVLYNKVHCVNYLINNNANIYQVDILGNSAYTLAYELQMKNLIKKFDKLIK